MVSTAASTSSLGRQLPAATLAVTCSGLVAPAMTEATAGRASSQPKARSSTRVALPLGQLVEGGHGGQALVGELALGPIAPGGHAGALRRRLAGPVLAAQQPAGQGEVGQEGDAGARRTLEDPVLGLAVEDAVLVLHADEPGLPAGVAAAASSSMAAEKLEQPNSRTLPSATSSPSAPSVSAIGVFGSGRCSW